MGYVNVFRQEFERKVQNKIWILVILIHIVHKSFHDNIKLYVNPEKNSGAQWILGFSGSMHKTGTNSKRSENKLSWDKLELQFICR